MEKIKFKEDHLKMNGDGYAVEILYDEKPLLYKDRFSNWKYVTEENGQLLYTHLKNFNDEHFQFFIDDIVEQLMCGIDRNNLTMNIPHEVKRIKMGDKIIEI